MVEFDLSHGQWQLRASAEDGWIPTEIPGEVHLALLQAGRIPDPFVADHELALQWVAESDWEFMGLIELPEAIRAQERIWLTFDGLDTLAQVRLNGQLLGQAENAFRTYAWEVTEMIKPGVNQVKVEFSSPVKAVNALQEQFPLLSPEQSIPGGPHLRKASCQWGWDWGPQLPPIGIWKGARFSAYSTAKFDGIQIRQAHQFDGSVEISAEVQIQQWREKPLQLCLTLTDPNGRTFATTCKVVDRHGVAKVVIPEPLLWWPNGYGEQALYSARVKLLSSDERELDIKDFQIGLRTLELQQQPDEYGESFSFVVNGVPIFAKGANWIPADSFPTRINREVLAQLLQDAALAHHNMIRVWGGGFYESEDFYDLCDQFGILVWQDFVFSCSVYPLNDPEFIENVRHEVLDNVRRIRHRACLALWCGNNEMELGWESWGWSTPEMEALQAAYRVFFYATLPGWLEKLDPDTPYWYSSPSSGTPFEDCDSQDKGDAHYWEVWHGAQPFSAYREQLPRFMSEFGFQSLPPLKTIQYYADEAYWNLTDYMIEHHQRSPYASALFMGQMALHFMMPADFPSLVYLTMVLQAEAIRYGVEHWRRNMHRVSGTLYWQLNDCWPVASWSSLDYFGRWKALHYASRKFYAPILLSIVDDEGKAHMAVHLTSDLQTEWAGKVNWRLLRLDGEVLERGAVAVVAAPLASQQVLSLDFGHLSLDEKRELVFVAQLEVDGEVLTTQLATFVRNKHLKLVDPGLKAMIAAETDEEITITLQADYLARFVQLSVDDADLVFSDNYFDVLPGEQVCIHCKRPTGWTLDDFGKSLTVFSLYDSFA